MSDYYLLAIAAWLGLIWLTLERIADALEKP